MSQCPSSLVQVLIYELTVVVEQKFTALQMLRSSKTIILSTLLYMFALAGYNISGMYITDELGAVTRTVLEALRTLFVWVLDLLLFYGPVMVGVIPCWIV